MVLFFMQNKSLISREINLFQKVVPMLIKNVNKTDINSLNNIRQVVSLVPSLTETIAALGAAEMLTGITRFCKYPEDICRKVTRVGGTKDFDVEKIIGLQPDGVVAVKEENDQGRLLQLARMLPVVLFDIVYWQDAMEMITGLGKLLNKEKQARQMISEIENSFNTLPEIKPRNKCVYLIWKKPWMAAGKETFINEMLKRAGFENVVEGRYPEITEETFSEAEVILLSSEPYPFREKDRHTLQEQYPGKKVLPADGEMFSWYGSRMSRAAAYFRELRQQLS
jgi:ABC-type Fe3+-hydroxamate transport system substrate-binding protein